jgi:methylglutaconyl-CoA hydratase
MLGKLLACLREIVQRTSDVRCVVLSASGSWFCAGMDLLQMQETAALPNAPATWREDTQLYHDVVKTLFDLPMPTVAVVTGGAVAGGLGLMLACDLAVVSAQATFALPEPKRGITAAVVTPLLVYRTNPSGAAYVLLSGQTLDATQARQMGLCQIIAEIGRLEDAAEGLVRSILSGAPGALAVTKTQLRLCTAEQFSAQLVRAAAVSAQARESPEAREGLQAFLEKRSPAWSPT